MSVTIYRYGSILARATIDVDDSSQQQQGLMRENILVLSCTVVNEISFQIGDYCHFIGVLYQINRKPAPTRNYIGSVSYAIQMEGEMYDLGKVKYLFLNSVNNFTDLIFTLRGKLVDFGDLIIYNMRRQYPTADWKLGFVDDTDYQTLDFTAQNCLQALQTIATAFTTEYVFDGKTIHLYQRQTSSQLTLEVGEGKAMWSLTEQPVDQSNIITRLYVLGSTRNITPDYRSGSKSLKMPGGIPYLEKNVSLYRTFEDDVIFDGSNGLQEIYPHRTGTVTAVDDPFNFYDDTIDFNVNDYLLPSPTSAKVTFNTGLLSGYTFDIAEDGFNNTTKKFTILKDTDETTIDVPSVSYTPAIGDTYVLTDIRMPQSYIDAAEAALEAAGQDYLDKNSVPALVYTGVLNTLYFQRNNIQLQLCQTAHVRDAGLNINKNIRVTAFTRNVNNIYIYTMELSETVNPKSTLVKLLNGL